MSDPNQKKSRRVVHFLHIGKTGGSAVRAVLDAYRETAEFRLELHGHATSLRDVPEGEVVVLFLRDPVSRFVSGFYSRQRKGQPRYYSEWSEEEKIAFETFATPNQLACSLADEQSAQHSNALRAMRSVEHLAPYKHWYGDLDYFRSRIEDIFFIGFQESLDSHFAQLMEILGIAENPSLPEDDVVAHRNPKGLDKTIEEHGLSALRRWYSEDYRFFDLCKEIRATKDL